MRQPDRGRQGHGRAVRRRHDRRDRLGDHHLAARHEDGREGAGLARQRRARARGRLVGGNVERGRGGDFGDGGGQEASGGFLG